MRHTRDIFTVLILLAVIATSTRYAHAIIGGGSMQVGVRETVRNAGVDNWTIQMYYTPDGQQPGAGARPFAFIESNQLEPAVPGVPFDPDLGRPLPGKFWALVKFKALNAGEIRKMESEAQAIALPFSEALGGYLIDLAQFKGEKIFVGVSVTHLGGEVTYQVVIFLFRSRREVTDQAGFWLGIYDPGRPMYEAEVKAFSIMRGFEAVNAAHAYAAAHNGERQMQFPIARTAQPGDASVVVSVWQDGNRLQPAPDAVVQLLRPDNSPATDAMRVVNGRAEFKVPAGNYRLAVAGGGTPWAPQNPNHYIFTVPEQGAMTIDVVPQASLVRRRVVQQSSGSGR